MSNEFFASAPRGAAESVRDELQALGVTDATVRAAGVEFTGDLELGYRACLWLRAASRLLLVLGSFEVDDEQDLYAAVHALDWDEHLAPDGTLAVDCRLRRGPISHSHYAALKVKDAVVDRLRERHGRRPSVAVDAPGLRLNLFVDGSSARLAVDLGGALHRRGYRERSVPAPLRENLAAALLLRAGWPAVAARGGSLIDPMCGSGTLPIEAALIAGDIAPGLLRGQPGSPDWRGHDALLWGHLREEAVERRETGKQRMPPIVACDRDAAAIEASRHNAGLAGVAAHVRIERRALGDWEGPGPLPAGLIVANPPYGERLGDSSGLTALYAELGGWLRAFDGWQAAVLTSEAGLGRALGLRSRRAHRYFNGALECRLQRFDIAPRYFVEAAPAGAAATEPAASLVNRLRKNLRTIGRWAERSGIGCYRLYDADIPEYALAVDLYRAERLLVHVQEYAAPASVDRRRARQRRAAALAAIAEVTGAAPAQIYYKLRRRQRGVDRYIRLATTPEWHEVHEAGARLLIDLRSHLDSGLFLSHRDVRGLIAEHAAGARFLNLFAYTGAATVRAARAGARESLTIDLSSTYLDWARRNLELNGCDSHRHRLLRADCLDWLGEAGAAGRYDLILLDPPTFSNSAKMTGTLDLQRDHVALVRATAELLAQDGMLVFSCNAHRFRLDTTALADLDIVDVSRRTLPRDFARRPRAHHCWLVRRPAR